MVPESNTQCPPTTSSPSAGDGFWRPYEPSGNGWGVRHVVHLYRRAAWGAMWDEIECGVDDGLETSAARLLTPGNRSHHADLIEALDHRSAAQQDIGLLQAAWIMRMWHGSDPLGEQLTLMWHNHFATSQLKVRDVGAMREHLDRLRRHARAPFPELLAAMMRDKALILWLDADTNRRESPNENLARELLELFTLGRHGQIGQPPSAAGEPNYSERDVQEAARALTGWTVRDGKVEFEPELHDKGTKVILGVRGRHGLDELLAILVSHPATYWRVAWRICDHFFGPGVITADGIDAIARHLQATNWSIAHAVATVIRSAAFFHPDRMGRRIASPASLAVAMTRSLEAHGRDGALGLSPEVAAAWMRGMGQDLLRPPGVAGWPGGHGWLGATAIVQRARLAVRLAQGTLHRGAPRIDLESLARRYRPDMPPLEFGAELLFGQKGTESLVSQDSSDLEALLASTSAQFD